MQGGRSRNDNASSKEARSGRAANARGGGSGGNGTSQAPLQAKLQQHIDREDYRIKTLTESILSNFLPAVINAVCSSSSSGGSGGGEKKKHKLTSEDYSVSIIIRM